MHHSCHKFCNMTQLLLLHFNKVQACYQRDHIVFLENIISKWVISVSVTTMKSMICAKPRVHYGLKVVFICLPITQSHYHHDADLSEGIEYMNSCWVYSVYCVSKINSILSFIFYAVCRAVCFQRFHFSFDSCPPCAAYMC